MILRSRYFPYISIFMFAISFYSFYINVQRRAHFCMIIDDHLPQLPKNMCQNLRRSITEMKLKAVNIDVLKQQVNGLQQCPWIPNQNYLNMIKSELEICCDAKNNLLVTQNNTQIGDIIIYEMQEKKQIQVDEKIHQMLPETSPFLSKPFKQCAVVGNGGILLNSCCGSEIDMTDYVFRFNLPPMNQSYDIGTKIDIVTANPSILIERYSKLNERRKPFAEMLKTYGSSLILMPAFSYSAHTDLAFRVFYTLQDFGPGQKVVFFHPKYLKNLYTYWKKKGIDVKRLSSGFMLVSTALELCEKVKLYGFWPFSQDPEGNPIPHHYYDNRQPKPGFHSMPDEFFFYAQMHSHGVLQLQTGQCP